MGGGVLLNQVINQQVECAGVSRFIRGSHILGVNHIIIYIDVSAGNDVPIFAFHDVQLDVFWETAGQQPEFFCTVHGGKSVALAKHLAQDSPIGFVVFRGFYLQLVLGRFFQGVAP